MIITHYITWRCYIDRNYEILSLDSEGSIARENNHHPFNSIFHFPEILSSLECDDLELE